MKNLLIATFTLLSVSANAGIFTSETKPSIPAGLALKCIEVSETVERCENSEVICYKMGNGIEDGHTSCKFKDEKTAGK